MDITLWEDNIAYFHEGFDTPNSMTAYLIQTWQKVPAIVILPGGAYTGRAEHEGESIAKYYNSMGITESFPIGFPVHWRMRSVR